MKTSELTCCFTGHRLQKFSFKNNENDPRCLELRTWLNKKVAQFAANGYRRFITGMALGTDQWGAQAVILQKQIYGDITLEAAIPYKSFHESWSSEHQKTFLTIINQCSEIQYLSDQFSMDAIFQQNYYMVDHSESVIGIWDGRQSGGTYRTIHYAKRQHKNIICLNPDTMEQSYCMP